MSPNQLLRRRWLLLRWLGLRWERRLAWLVLILFCAAPIVLSATFFWYVRSGRLVAGVESQLASVLGVPVKIEGLQVKGWHRYAVAQLTLLGPDPSRPLLRAKEGTVTTGQAISATFAQAAASIADEGALAGWRRLLETSTTAEQPGPSLEFIVSPVTLEGGLPPWSRLGTQYPTAECPPLQGAILITPDRRRIRFHGLLGPQKTVSVEAEKGSSGLRLVLSPPLALGPERLATSLGWPSALVPADLEGSVTLTEGPRGRSVSLTGGGTLELGDVARALGVPNCSGKATLKTELELLTGLDAGRSHGQVSVALTDSGPATVDPLAVEVFRYIFFGQLSDRAVEEDAYTLDRIAFTVTLAGDRVTVAGEGGPLLSGRSERGYTIELTGPAQATTEELARRLRLALGGLPTASGSEVDQGAGTVPAPASP